MVGWEPSTYGKKWESAARTHARLILNCAIPKKKVARLSEKGTDLKRKEELFCLEYAVDYNGTAAAKRAGYAEKSAAKTACRLLKDERVMARIRVLQKEQAERLCLSSDLIVIRALELYDKCTQAVPVQEWDYTEHKMVNTGEYQLDSKGAVKCLELLGKHIGMFEKDNRDMGDGPVFIRDDIGVTDHGE